MNGERGPGRASLRVGMLAPVSWRVPPRHYGPWEKVVWLLTEGLVRRGVDVTLFATADSITSARLAAVCPAPYSEDPTLDAKVWECLHISEAFERAAEFDLIHNHFDFLPLSYCGLTRTPVVTTIHGFSSERILPVYQKYNRRAYYVAISDADRHPTLDYVATVHHGIRVEDYRLSEGPRDYLLFFGRIHPDKGAAEAIEVAQRTGRRLLLAGIVQDQGYFEQRVAPHLDGDRVRYLGPVAPEHHNELLGGAAALLHLIRFREPFGLSMIEAMACGTPVIARGLGAVPEIVRPGKSGFLVTTVEEAAAAVDRIGELDPRRIRSYAAEHFSSDRMVNGYLHVYEEVLRRHAARRAEQAA